MGHQVLFGTSRRAISGVQRDFVPLLVSDHETRNIKYFLFMYRATDLKRLPRILDGRLSVITCSVLAVNSMICS